jgi:EmrB/QacA subfamily drug resistance transporter
LWWLVAFRLLQAAGAAALTPTSLGLLLNAMPPQRRARAVRIWAATGALAAAAGPALGGVLVEASWKWVFLVNVPVGVIAFVAAVRKVPDSRDAAVSRTPDLVGAAFLAVGIGALALGLVKAPDWGWWGGGTVIAYAVTLVAIGVFVARTVTHPFPVVEPALLRVRAFAWANVTALLFSIAFAAGLLIVILWMQDVWAFSALQTGLAVAPGPVMVPIFAAVSQRVSHRVHVGLLSAAGCACLAIGNLTIAASVGATPAYASEILPGWLIAGAGVGLALPTIMSAATVDLPPARSATGSAVVNMSRQIGTVLGVAVLIALLGTHVGFAAVHPAFERGWWAIALFGLLGAVAAVGMTPRSPIVDEPVAT